MRLKELFSRHVAVVTLITLLVGSASALAVEDQFTVDLGSSGEILRGTGTGFNHGTWYYYPQTGQLVQWFFNGSIDRDGKKVVEVDLTIRTLDPQQSSHVEATLNWTKTSWPETQSGPPLPETQSPGPAAQYIEETLLFPRTDVRQSLFLNTPVEIADFCPQWVSIDIRGQNVSIEGRIRHDCVPKEGFVPPTGDRDFGDAPEGALAYPSLGIKGQFPTCIGVGPAAWIEHESKGRMYFGPKVDVERDGNAGRCPTFSPDQYDRDEGMGTTDGDAGLLKPRAYTIKGPVGTEDVYPLIFTGLESLGNACYIAIWGTTIDIEVRNAATDGREAYVNLLMDWNHDGKWEGAVLCDGTTEVAEHVLSVLSRRGVPNYFGPQRFGNRQDNHWLGKAVVRNDIAAFADLLLGHPDEELDSPPVFQARTLYEQERYEEAARLWPGHFFDQRRALRILTQSHGNKKRVFYTIDKHLKGLYISAYQSDLFNRVLAARMPHIDKLLLGDMAYLHVNGACFRVEQPEVEQPRCDRFEISPTGPLLGGRTTRLTGPAGAIENPILDAESLDENDFRRMKHLGARGGRRPLRFQPRAAAVTSGEDDLGPYLEFRFELDAGCYATSLIAEVTKDRTATATEPEE